MSDGSTSLKQARQTLGLTASQMGVLLGYQGPHVRQMIYEIETGKKPLMPCQSRLLQAYLDGYRPSDWPLPVEGDSAR